MGIRTEQNLAGARMPLLRQCGVTNARIITAILLLERSFGGIKNPFAIWVINDIVEILDPLLFHELTQNIDVAVRLGISRENVVIRDDDNFVPVPNLGFLAEFALENADGAGPANIVSHQDVGVHPDIITCLDARFSGSSGKYLFGQRHKIRGRNLADLPPYRNGCFMRTTVAFFADKPYHNRITNEQFRRIQMKFRVASWLLAALSLVSASSKLGASNSYDQVVRPFLTEYCIRCHGEKSQKGDFRVDTLAIDFSSQKAAAHWGETMFRITSGEMPPEDEKKPTPDEALKVTEWISERLKEGEAARLAKRGPVTFHKVTREEFANTIYDLLGVHFNATDPTGLPEDPDWQGFERIGSVLSFSPAHIEKYLAAAEAIVNEALPAAPPKTMKKHRGPFDLRYHGSQREKAQKFGLADRARVELWPGDGLDVGSEFPVTGEYRMRVKVSGLKPPKGRAPHLTLYAKGLDRMLFEEDVITPEDQPRIIDFTFHITAGHHDIRLTCEAPGPSNLPRHGRFDAGRFFTTLKESDTGRQPWQYKLTDEDFVPIRPFLIVDYVEIEGPIQSSFPSPQQKKIFGQGNHDLAHGQTILSNFTQRAFRRPVQSAEVERYVKLVDKEMQSGETFETAIKASLVAVLCSKDFLFIVEGSKDRTSNLLNDWELATRLSYFLWSSMPDERLFSRASTNGLRNPEVLKEEVARMLKDPKAARFASGFPQQWLQLKKVGMFTPDKKLYPDYDAHLEKSMRAEGREFFREVLASNLSIREFLDSNWTMLNARLAEHYGIAGVQEDAFRKVILNANNHRGGLLTQAGVLTLTSDGLRHRPVHRGKWLLETVFNKPPPPPPANVKPIQPTPATQPKATLRMKLQAHISDPNCAACHKKIDPLGLAFDNYDAIGRWRTEEVVSDGQGSNPLVDASGVLADGRSFANAAELKRLLLADTDKFALAFIEKLSTYALRRAMTVDDRLALTKLAERSKTNNYRLRDLVESMVLSQHFSER